MAGETENKGTGDSAPAAGAPPPAQAPAPAEPPAPAPAAPAPAEPQPEAPKPEAPKAGPAPEAKAEPKADDKANPEAKAEEAPKTAAETPTLLEEAGKKPEGDKKAAEAKPEEGAKPGEKPGEAKAEAPKVEPLKYEPFQLPEGVKLNGEQFKEAETILGTARVPQEAAQSLVNLHVKALQDYATHMANEQQRVFAETRKGWRTEVMGDDLIGGAGHQTAMGVVARMRDLFVPEAERVAFNNMLRVTGVGDHPLFNKLLYRIGMKFDEPSPAPLPHNPAPDNGKRPGGRRGALYDHPTSAARRGNGAH